MYRPAETSFGSASISIFLGDETHGEAAMGREDGAMIGNRAEKGGISAATTVSTAANDIR